MAKELELKLQLQDPRQIPEILSSPLLLPYLQEPVRRIPMETTYFDNEIKLFSRLHWTLRQRKEGEEDVLCLKTPSEDPSIRNEYQVCASTLSEDGIRSLIEAGAPSVLLDYYKDSPVAPICGARFLRRCTMLQFPDGSRAELALDQGELFGSKGTLPILELELELYEGTPNAMIELAKSLCTAFSLHPQPHSKFARAKTLG
ncbi:MAG: CYTH domain-containing protein [Oscillospiraceae bacterium]|nr:CYTH domain-containing protein [Oscillospiraceae bacterium]